MDDSVLEGSRIQYTIKYTECKTRGRQVSIATSPMAASLQSLARIINLNPWVLALPFLGKVSGNKHEVKALETIMDLMVSILE